MLSSISFSGHDESSVSESAPYPCDYVLLCSNRPSIAGVPPGGLALPHNLDDLSTPEAKVPPDGIADLDARQLTLLQPIPFQQSPLVLTAQHDVFWDEFVVSDVHQEILLHEGLDDAREYCGDDLQCHGGDGVLRHDDTGVEVVRGYCLRKGPEMLHADGDVGEKLYPYGADGRGWTGVRCCGRRGVFKKSGGRGSGGEIHLSPTGVKRDVSEKLDSRGGSR